MEQVSRRASDLSTIFEIWTQWLLNITFLVSVAVLLIIVGIVRIVVVFELLVIIVFEWLLLRCTIIADFFVFLFRMQACAKQVLVVIVFHIFMLLIAFGHLVRCCTVILLI